MSSSASTRPSTIATGRKPISPGKRPSPRRAKASIDRSGRNGKVRFRSASAQPEFHTPHHGLVTHAVVETLCRSVELVHVELDRLYAVCAAKRVHMLHE